MKTDMRKSVRAYHRSHGPDISAGTPLGTENDFGRSVLTGLDIVGEVVTDPAGIT